MSTEIKSPRQFASGFPQPLPHALLTASWRLGALAAAQHLGMACRTYGLDHFEDALAHAAFADLVVGAHQLERLALDQRILLLLERRAGLAEALAAAARHRPARQGVGGHLVEEVRHRHVEHL